VDEFSKLRTGWAFIIALAIFIFIFALLALPSAPEGRILAGGWRAEDGQGGVQEGVALPRVANLRRESELSLSARIKPESGERLYIPRPSAEYLLVSWDGEPLLELSSRERPSGNIWNRVYVLEPPYPGEAELRITLRANHDLGLPQAPFLSASATVLNRIRLSNFLHNEFIYILMGSMACMGLLLISRALRRGEGASAGALIGMASLFGIFYLVDFVFAPSYGSQLGLFWQKKLSYTSGYIASFLYVIGAEKFLVGRISRMRILSVPILAGAAFILVCWNQWFFWLGMNILNFFLLLYICYLTFILLRKDRRGLGLHIPGFLLAFSLIQLLAIMIFKLAMPYVMEYAVAIDAIFLGMAAALNPAARAKPAGEAGPAMRDPLTGLPGRAWMERVRVGGPGSAAVMRLRGFPEFVRRDGQKAGDMALSALAEILKARLRRSDIVLHLEGETFAAIMEDVPEDRAVQALDRVKAEFERHRPDPGLCAEYAISPIDEEAAEAVDKALALMEPRGAKA
jgi:GGDEF domain-containing protein